MKAVGTFAGLRLLALAALAALACLAVPAAPALAHAGLLSSDPASGSSLQDAPRRIVLTFAEDPDPKLSVIRLLDADGQVVAGVLPPQGVPGHPSQLQVTITQDLRRGVYTVGWRSVSAVDGHVQNGAFAFGVGVTPAPENVKAADLLDASPWMSALAALGRWLLYAGLAVFVGAASACLLVFGGRLPSGGVTLLRLALVAAVVGFCAMIWAERALSGAPSLLPLFQARHGQLLLGLGVAMVFCAAAVVTVDLWPARWSLALLGAAGAAAMFVHVIAGHANAPSSLWPAAIAVQWVHLVAIGIWVGGLAWLLLGIRGRARPERAAAVHAFSKVATLTLAIVLATGVARGVAEVGSLGGLLDTGYGRTLLVKVGLVIVLVGLGALNHFRWVPALEQHEGAARVFRLNSAGELVVMAVVLATTALLSGLAPPVSAEAKAAPRAQVVVSGSDYATTVRVQLKVTPGTAGANWYVARVDGYDSGEPLASARAVQLEFSLPAKPSVATTTQDLTRAADGTWRGRGLQLSIVGRWAVDVLVEEDAGGVIVPLTLQIGSPGVH